jgi:hypothetical protein
MKQIFPEPGQLYFIKMPCSEVMMCMKLVDKIMPIRLEHNMVQLYSPNNTNEKYSSAVTPGEAGLYWSEKHSRFYFNQDSLN